MNEDLPPVTLGSAGLTGRPRIERVPDLERPIDYDEHGEPIYAVPAAEGPTIPPSCLRVMNSPLPPERGGGCPPNCPGQQEDGGCLCDVVKAAQAAGVEWSFDVSLDPFGNQRWTYSGEPIPTEGA